jgi:hypothetical protein
LNTENHLLISIGRRVSVQFPQAWRIFLRYIIMRFAALTQEDIVALGNFLNYGITWDEAENVFGQLSDDETVSSRISALFELHQRLGQEVTTLTDARVINDVSDTI